MSSFKVNLCVTLLCVLMCSTSWAEVFNLKTANLTNVTPATRIIGGSPTTIENYPFAAQVQMNLQLICGGALLTPRHVLSAAHCFVDSSGTVYSAKMFSIRVGTKYLGTGGNVHAVSTIVVHEMYNNPLRDNDVAVLVLATSATLSFTVDFATIPVQDGVVPDDAPVTHIGWGTTEQGVSNLASVLKEVTVYKVNNNICAERYLILQSIYNESFPVTSSMMCAGLLDVGGKDACQGDSGGPLMFTNVVVGITSWGYKCADPMYPGVNARVASYTNWINETVIRYNSATSLSSSVTAIALLSWCVATFYNNFINKL